MLQPSTPSAATRNPPGAHVHNSLPTETCPWCEQEIPPERLEEISGKIKLREHEQAQAITARLEQVHGKERAQAEVKAKADLEAERRASAAREASARQEARTAAEAAANEKLAEVERQRQELEGRIGAFEMAKTDAEKAKAELERQLQQQRQESDAALTAARAEAAAKETKIRADAQREAEAAATSKLTEAEATHLQAQTELSQRLAEAERVKAASEETQANLQQQLIELRTASQVEIEQLKKNAAAEAIRIRAEATVAAQASMRHTLDAKEQALQEAAAKAAEAEDKLRQATEQQDALVSQRLASQREILEKDKEQALNAEKARAFEENQKLSNKVNELQRALEKKTNEELGEGAEVDLFEALKKEFPDDRIERIGRGTPGGDILHWVKLNGRECGTIIYDSKNHKQFRNDHVTKLRNDQLAAKAQHAVLSTHKFPQGTQQLHHQDGVLLANPARVVAVVTMIRQHVIQTYSLRMSNAERESKTGALYAFITSERCVQLLDRVDANAEALLTHQVKERAWHETAWKKEGELIRSIQKAKGALSSEISSIIGTGTVAEEEAPEARREAFDL